jgi:hypothetical protein
MKIVLPFILAAFLTGCSLLPTSKTQSEAVKAADSLSTQSQQTFRKVTTGTPAPTGPAVRVGGIWNRVTLPGVSPAPEVVKVAPGGVYAPSQAPVASALPPFQETVEFTAGSDQTVASKSSAKGTLDVSIPMGVKIGLVGVGLILLAWGVRTIRASSAAVNAAYGAADATLASRIRSWREKAVTATDPTEIAKLQSNIAELEADRGKLAR